MFTSYSSFKERSERNQTPVIISDLKKLEVGTVKTAASIGTKVTDPVSGIEGSDNDSLSNNSDDWSSSEYDSSDFDSSDFDSDDEDDEQSVKTNQTFACQRECKSSELMTPTQIQALLARQRNQSSSDINNNNNKKSTSSNKTNTNDRASIIRRSSEPNMIKLAAKTLHIQQHTLQTLCDEEEDEECDEEPVSPKELVFELLREQGFDDIAKVPYKDLVDKFYIPFNPSHATYEANIVAAVRQKDLQAFKSYHARGKNVLFRNNFGESVLHMCCRKNARDILQYILKKLKPSMRITCDGGRNPLHDCCWTSTPNFDVVRLVLEACPDLLLCEDKRGFVPLDYIPRDTWKVWTRFLSNNQHLLKPKMLY